MKMFYLRLKDKYGLNFLFLYLVLILYIITGFIDFAYFKDVGLGFLNIFIYQIIPVLIFVFVLMFIFNILISKDLIKQKIKKSGNLTKYFFSIIGGILSTGPVYMWYPFLKQLKDHGLNHGHIASFIYARSIKIPFLLIMIFYFGLKYTIIFNLVILFSAIIIGIFINLIFKLIPYENNNS
ncbi:MAG: hypothetical protein QM490_04945 [Candidatus Gracilibacteria bacterium]